MGIPKTTNWSPLNNTVGRENIMKKTGHLKIDKIRSLLPMFIVLVTLLGCSPKSKFAAGDYIMPEKDTNPSKILKVVGVGKENYKIFTHMLVDGRFVQAEDYQDRKRKEVDEGFVKIQPPKIEGSFSPDKWLSENKN
jgi:hypothetical protein